MGGCSHPSPSQPIDRRLTMKTVTSGSYELRAIDDNGNIYIIKCKRTIQEHHYLDADDTTILTEYSYNGKAIAAPSGDFFNIGGVKAKVQKLL